MWSSVHPIHVLVIPTATRKGTCSGRLTFAETRKMVMPGHFKRLSLLLYILLNTINYASVLKRRICLVIKGRTHRQQCRGSDEATRAISPGDTHGLRVDRESTRTARVEFARTSSEYSTLPFPWENDLCDPYSLPSIYVACWTTLTTLLDLSDKLNRVRFRHGDSSSALDDGTLFGSWVVNRNRNPAPPQLTRYFLVAAPQLSFQQHGVFPGLPLWRFIESLVRYQTRCWDARAFHWSWLVWKHA